MKNTKLNAQKILNKHCGLNDETATGISVINAMIEYGHNLVKNIEHDVLLVGKSEQLERYTNFLYENGYLKKQNALIEYFKTL